MSCVSSNCSAGGDPEICSSAKSDSKRDIAQLATEIIEPYVRRKRDSASSERSKKRLENLSEEEQNILREQINSKERRRMHNLNDALDELRSVIVIPYSESNGRKLSKISTVMLATNCIRQLVNELNRLKDQNEKLIHQLFANNKSNNDDLSSGQIDESFTQNELFRTIAEGIESSENYHTKDAIHGLPNDAPKLMTTRGPKQESVSHPGLTENGGSGGTCFSSEDSIARNLSPKSLPINSAKMFSCVTSLISAVSGDNLTSNTNTSDSVNGVIALPFQKLSGDQKPSTFPLFNNQAQSILNLNQQFDQNNFSSQLFPPFAPLIQPPIPHQFLTRFPSFTPLFNAQGAVNKFIPPSTLKTPQVAIEMTNTVSTMSHSKRRKNTTKVRKLEITNI